MLLLAFSERKHMIRFSDIDLLLPAIKKSLEGMGITEPTTIQQKALELLLPNFHQDLHAQAQTGTGKTLAFGIPLLQAIDTTKKQTQALVLAPTRELVCQIHDSLKSIAQECGVSIESVYGGMPIERQITRLRQAPHIVIGTPGRINDHLGRKTLRIDNLSILVLDEADIMLDMGFRQELDTVFEHAPKQRHIWLFSATVMPGIKDLIASHMKNVVVIASHQTNTASNQVKQYYCIVPQKQRTEVTARFIAAATDFYGIIFCRTRELCADVARELASKGIRVEALHGDMRQPVRNQIIKAFKNKEFPVLVATDVAARGIDVSDLTHVINYNMPDDNEGYVHRIGRTGRAGKEGIAILLVSPAEIYRMNRLQRTVKTVLLEIPIPSFESIMKKRIADIALFADQKIAETKNLSPSHISLLDLVHTWSDQKQQTITMLLLHEKFFGGIKGDLQTEKQKERPSFSPRDRRSSRDGGNSKGYHTRRNHFPREERQKTKRRDRRSF